MDVKKVYIFENCILNGDMNIVYNIMSYLIFNERYYFGLTSKDYFEKYFCKFPHPEIIYISKSKHQKKTL